MVSIELDQLKVCSALFSVSASRPGPCTPALTPLHSRKLSCRILLNLHLYELHELMDGKSCNLIKKLFEKTFRTGPI